MFTELASESQASTLCNSATVVVVVVVFPDSSQVPVFDDVISTQVSVDVTSSMFFLVTSFRSALTLGFIMTLVLILTSRLCLVWNDTLGLSSDTSSTSPQFRSVPRDRPDIREVLLSVELSRGLPPPVFTWFLSNQYVSSSVPWNFRAVFKLTNLLSVIIWDYKIRNLNPDQI